MNGIAEILMVILIALYTAALIFILLFSLTQAQLLFRYLFNRKKYKAGQLLNKQFATLPLVTVQLPVYNEKYVVERLIDCVAKLNYPADKLEIQVLDDSTDETNKVIAEKVAQLQGLVNIKHLHRANRIGFKAGALKEGLEKASGEFIAIFDADFLPSENFLLKSIPHFIDPAVGMVQTKWTWLNKGYSIITKVQAFALDTHFTIEQVGRNIGKSFINFNGTAGTWRKSCITDAGNWQAETLTEDLDLSYRAQLKNWKFIYLEEVNAPSELPPVMSAVKTQQYRWNKGGAETARKHLRKVLLSNQSFATKWHGVMHLLTSGVFLCIVTFAILSIPVLLIRNYYPKFAGIFKITDFFFVGFFILICMFFVSVSLQYKNKWKAIAAFLQTFPLFLSLSMGLSLHNAIAVLEGYFGKKSPFIRTPKFNVIAQSDKWSGNNYIKTTINKLTIFEAVLTIYFIGGILLAFKLHDFSLLPFHVLLAFGYGAVVYFTLFQQTVKRLTRRELKTTMQAA
ncbi:glycosyltransferase [soil metagenome]